jgi:NTE family protein
MSERPKVALVLGSGGLKCAAALGVRTVLEREGIDIDMIVGCSGGGVYASMLALGLTVEESLAITERGWTRRNMTRYRYRPLFDILLPKMLRSRAPFSMLDDRLFMQVLHESLGDKTFADTDIPLHLLATDLETGEKVVLSEGKIVDAMRASLAIPLIFSPHKIGGRTLVDGALRDPLPIDVAIKEGADIILAMGFELPSEVDIASMSSVANQTINTFINSLLVTTFAFYTAVHHNEIIPILPDFEKEMSLTDTHLLPHIIEEGARATEEQVPYLKRLLAAV